MYRRGRACYRKWFCLVIGIMPRKRSREGTSPEHNSENGPALSQGRGPTAAPRRSAALSPTSDSAQKRNGGLRSELIFTLQGKGTERQDLAFL